jgi:hypothetical protein
LGGGTCEENTRMVMKEVIKQKITMYLPAHYKLRRNIV